MLKKITIVHNQIFNVTFEEYHQHNFWEVTSIVLFVSVTKYSSIIPWQRKPLSVHRVVMAVLTMMPKQNIQSPRIESRMELSQKLRIKDI